jgi:hypothetical protein
MKKITIFLAFLISAGFSFGQNTPKAYIDLVLKAESLYVEKDFEKSALTYSDALKTIGWKENSDDRYNAARLWAKANYPDSAFFNLNRIATLLKYTNYEQITTDSLLSSLYSDNRWKPLLEIIKQNKEMAEERFNKPLVAQLDSIYTEDQKYREQIGEIVRKYGWESKEIKTHWKFIIEKDSVNLLKVKAILDKYGWLGADVVSEQGNSALFLVIQHSDLATQEKYLPMMKEAVNNGKASDSDLALLIDRVALRQGKKQIYGSQIGTDPKTQLNYVSPLEDPDNVDKRRSEVGLQPIADYVYFWQLKWDVEQYKKDLPAIEAIEKTRKK